MSSDAKRNLTPTLRFPEFRNEPTWAIKQLGHLCRIQTGKKDANEGSENGPYPFFTCAEKHTYSDSYSFDAEAILIAGNANVGQARYYHGKFEAYQRTYVLTDFVDIHVPYLFSILSTRLRPSLLSQVQVSAMSYIKLPMLTEYELPTPPLPAEQQKIAECLSTLEELIGAESQKLDALKTHKKGLMQHLFPREGETTPNARFDGFSEPWKEKALGELSTTTIGEFVIKTKQRPDAPYPVFNGGRSHTGFYDQYNNEGNKIVISARGANAGYVNIVKRRYWAGNSCYSVSLNDRNNSLDFVYWFMKQNEKTFIENQHAANIPAVSKGHVERFKIRLPSSEEQQRIASCLCSLDDLIAGQSAKVEALHTHKKGLMQQLFPSPTDTDS